MHFQFAGNEYSSNHSAIFSSAGVHICSTRPSPVACVCAYKKNTEGKSAHVQYKRGSFVFAQKKGNVMLKAEAVYPPPKP